jgi:hypothetical protein
MLFTTFVGNTSHSQISNFVKIRPEGAELYHADGRTDGRTDRQKDRHQEVNSRFSQFCERACFENAPNEWYTAMNTIANGLMELSLSGFTHLN